MASVVKAGNSADWLETAGGCFNEEKVLITFTLSFKHSVNDEERAKHKRYGTEQTHASWRGVSKE